MVLYKTVLVHSGTRDSSFPTNKTLTKNITTHAIHPSCFVSFLAMPFPQPKHGPDIQIGLHLAWDLKEIKVEQGVLKRKILWQDTRYSEPIWKEETCITFINTRIARRSRQRSPQQEKKSHESKHFEIPAIDNKDDDDDDNDDNNEQTNIKRRKPETSRTFTSDVPLENSQRYPKKKPTNQQKRKVVLQASLIQSTLEQNDSKRHPIGSQDTINISHPRPQRTRQPTNRFVPPNTNLLKNYRAQSPRQIVQEAMKFKPDPSSEVSSSEESFHSNNSSWSDIQKAPAKEKKAHTQYASFHQLHKSTPLDIKIPDSGSMSDNSIEEWCAPIKPRACLGTAREKKQQKCQAQHISRLSDTRCYHSKDIQNIRALSINEEKCENKADDQQNEQKHPG